MAATIRTRSLLDRATAWSPVLLLGGLAALTYWLDSQVQPPAPRRDGSERHDPDIFVEGFRAVELDAEGPADAARSPASARCTSATTRPPRSSSRCCRRPKPASPRSASPRRMGNAVGRPQGRRTSRATCAPCATPARPSPAKAAAGPVTVTTEYLHVVPDKEIATHRQGGDDRGAAWNNPLRRARARQQGQDAQAQIRRQRHPATASPAEAQVHSPNST